ERSSWCSWGLAWCSSRISRESAEILAQDLAHVRLGQRVEEAHLLRHLVGSELPPAMRDHVIFGERGARRLGHEQPHGLAGLLVLLAERYFHVIDIEQLDIRRWERQTHRPREGGRRHWIEGEDRGRFRESV